MQRHSAVATSSVKNSVLWTIGSCSVSNPINPSIRVAVVLDINPYRALIDSQIQRHHAVTTCGVGISVRRCIRTIRVIRIPPSKAIASHNRRITQSGVVNRQMQRYSRIAPRSISTNKDVCWHLCASGIRHTIDPSIRITSGNSCITSSRVINRQMQRHSAITPSSISTNKSVRQRFCAFRYFCGTIPSKAIASHSRGITSRAVVNGEMQRNRRITPRSVPANKRVRQRFCAFCYFCGTIPNKAIASHRKGIARSRVINCQMQGNHTITSRDISQSIIVNS